jgi:myo-inositol-1(or 4)-monophosphatase
MSCAQPQEEDVAPGAEASAQAVGRLANEEHLWIVDPIDGTTNFAHGMPLSGVIIAYASKGVCVFGLIFDPFREVRVAQGLAVALCLSPLFPILPTSYLFLITQEMFVAWRGKGAYMNGKQIKCCSTPDLSGAVVATGSPPDLAALAACLRATELISPKVRTVRMLGSAAVMLSWVAMGRLTAYFEADLNVWDLAAGALMIEEAGGRVTDAHGNRFKLTTRNLVATNGKIHDALLVDMVDSEMWIK